LRQARQLGLHAREQPGQTRPVPGRRVIWLQGAQEEAMVSIVDNGDARLIVIQRTQGVRP